MVRLVPALHVCPEHRTYRWYSLMTATKIIYHDPSGYCREVPSLTNSPLPPKRFNFAVSALETYFSALSKVLFFCNFYCKVNNDATPLVCIVIRSPSQENEAHVTTHPIAYFTKLSKVTVKSVQPLRRNWWTVICQYAVFTNLFIYLRSEVCFPISFTVSDNLVNVLWCFVVQ